MSAVAEHAADAGSPRGDDAASGTANIHAADAAPRWPGDGKDFRVTMGLHACHPHAWLLPAAAAPDLIANKAAVLAQSHEDAFAVLPEGDAAAREAAHVLFTHIATQHPEVAGAVPELHVGEVDRQHPLEHVGRLIAEDICIMTPHLVRVAASESPTTALPGSLTATGVVTTAQTSSAPNANDCAGVRAGVADDAAQRSDDRADTCEYRLTAALLCAPSRWSLHEKLGTNLRAIHGPVPGYDTIAAPTDKFFARLPVGQIMERTNWSVLDSPVLFQPGLEHMHTKDVADCEGAYSTGDEGDSGVAGNPALGLAGDSPQVGDSEQLGDSAYLVNPARVGHSERLANSEQTVPTTQIESPQSHLILQQRWLRLERQTLCKLSQTGAVIFTILTSNTRLDELAAQSPDVARQLAHKMRTAPQETCLYKGWSDAAAIADALEVACSAA